MDPRPLLIELNALVANTRLPVTIREIAYS